MARRRAALVDVLGLGFLLFLLLDYLRPSLLLLPTIAAGGDTPCHYPAAVYFREHLLPHLRFHGWYPGAYLGQPLLLYYFPLPFLLIAALAPLAGMPVSFKLGIALGVFLLPFFAYLSFRLLGFPFPGPLLAASAALVFLFLEDNPIWGGTIASTLTGEFAYTYGIGLALVFLGLVYGSYSRGGSVWLPGAALALTALAHGYAVLWAGLSATYFLYRSRRPLATLAWLGGVALTALALAGFWLLPLLAGWGWTTPYADPWITVTAGSLAPPLLWPLFACALLGLGWTALSARRSGGADHRLLFLLHAALVAGALAAGAPVLGVIDVRFVPFAQLALCLAGAASVGVVLETLAAPDLAALGLVLAFGLYADGQSRVARSWIDWNMTGLESKELWPSFRALAARLRGSVADPRVAVEYSKEHERAGSIRMYETLPFFSGRATLEGVYNQASLATPFVYYLASELDAVSPNPFRSLEYSSFDTDNALRHLRLFAVGEIVALSPALTSALGARADVSLLARIPPYSVFRLAHPGGYVEPLAYAPVRSRPKGWREKAYRWFTRKPQSPVPLVFSDDPRFTVVEKDEWLPPPAVPLDAGVEVEARLEPESLTIHTSRPGHPLLVKVSYHPRWRAEGADGPYLVSPALMMVVPRQQTVRLVYARTLSDDLGLALTLGALLAAAAWGVARAARPRWARWLLETPPPPGEPAATLAALLQAGGDACDLPRPRRRWGGAVPAGLLLILAAGRGAGGGGGPAIPVDALYERATRAYAAERYPDAAEYAREALGGRPGAERAAGLHCLRGESLLESGSALEAAEEFETVTRRFPSSPYVPEALFGAVQARTAAGDPAAAAEARERLLGEFGHTPWAARLRAESASRRP